MASHWGERVEPAFRAWARFVVAHPWRVLLPTLALAFLAIAGLARLRIDVSFESFLEQDDPVLIAYEAFADTFGRDERIVISASPGRPSRKAFSPARTDVIMLLIDELESTSSTIRMTPPGRHCAESAVARLSRRLSASASRRRIMRPLGRRSIYPTPSVKTHSRRIVSA